jgi:hypothetical protein
MNKYDAISDNMTAYRNLYYYLEGTFDGCEVSHVSRASNEEADNLANIGSQCLPIPQGVFWEEIIEISIKNSKASTTGEQVQSHDDRGNLDATILGVYGKQNTTRRYSTSKKDNTTIQGFRRVARKIIQEKYNRRFAMVRYSSRRIRNLKGHPRRGMWASRLQQSHCSQSLSCSFLLAYNY